VQSDWDDGNDAGPDGDEWSEDAWDADDDSVDTIRCGHCAADVYEDAEQCPHCGEWIIRGRTSSLSGKPVWWQIAGLLGIIAVILALLQ